jgi:hypothetical protein
MLQNEVWFQIRGLMFHLSMDVNVKTMSNVYWKLRSNLHVSLYPHTNDIQRKLDTGIV